MPAEPDIQLCPAMIARDLTDDRGATYKALLHFLFWDSARKQMNKNYSNSDATSHY